MSTTLGETMNKYDTGKYNYCTVNFSMESYTATSRPSTHTSTACDTPSIKVDITDIRYHSVNF